MTVGCVMWVVDSSAEQETEVYRVLMVVVSLSQKLRTELPGRMKLCGSRDLAELGCAMIFFVQGDPFC